MKKHYTLITSFLILIGVAAQAQYAWTWEPLPAMPEAISNNAVSQATVGGEHFVYSFGGIDTSKTSTGISGTAMRLTLSTGEWEYIPPLPDSLGKIASAASQVSGLIYIIGGYHVFEGEPFELSSDRVHRYDPVSNQYLSDGAPIPVPIDDHVQAVWRDSLIYVITGWSDTENVPDVQIYNPSLDTWTAGTQVPNGPQYEAFGASGTIVGDTIYYHGGAAGIFFNGVRYLRKGVIDPDDPSQITWTYEGLNPGVPSYRAAAISVGGQIFWIGGSGITYNYDGLAYDNSGGVPALPRILNYDTSAETWSAMNWQPYAVMDLRGIAAVGGNQFVICGGMQAEQAVSDQAYLLSYEGPSALPSFSEDEPRYSSVVLPLSSIIDLPTYTECFDQRGRLIGQASASTKTSLSHLGINKQGVYYLRSTQGVQQLLVQ